LDRSVVLDSYAILAVISDEPGSDLVADLPRGALLSSVNLVEVHTKLLLDGSVPDFAWGRILSIGCDICIFDEKQARIASEMVWKTRSFGLSLGDRACLALAIQRNATVYTADQAWKELSLQVEIKLIR
jgi:ribonuclease VapC